MTENASVCFPDARCRIPNFVTDLWWISKAAAEAKAASEEKAKAEAEAKAAAEKAASQKAAAEKAAADAKVGILCQQ